MVWSSSNLNVARVSDTGRITAVNSGRATIQARVGTKLYKCNVTVVSSTIRMSKNSLSLYVGGNAGNTARITATPRGANTSVSWMSLDENIATVDNGKITAIAPGETVIRATANNVSADCKVKVTSTNIEVDRPYALIGNKGVGNKVKLNASVTGASATVTWTSSDKTIATVSKGDVVGKKSGLVVITATANGVSDSCYVEVKEGLSLDKTSIVLYTDVNDSETLKTNAPRGTSLVWESSDESIAKVINGVVVPVNEGEAVITAKAAYSNGETDDASCSVKVLGTSTSIEENSIGIKNKYEGNSYNLNYTILGKSNKAKWTSSNTRVATVSAYGVVTGKGVGECDITLYANGKTDSVRVSVSEYTPKISINISKYTLYTGKGNVLNLRASAVGPSRTVTWSTEDESVASVNASGKVTAKAEGTTHISATANGVSAECEIKVIDSKIILNSTALTVGKGGTGELEVDVIGQSLNYTVKSTNSKVATIKNGVIQGVNVGSADIIVSANGIQNVCHVLVGDCEHEYSVEEEVNANCTQDGYRIFKCSKCNANYRETIKRTGHNYNEGVLDAGELVLEPTCTENGILRYTCILCGDKKNISVGPTGHSYGLKSEVKEVKCDEDGSNTFTCLTCGEKKVEIIPATGHSLDWVVTEPTYDLEGLKEFCCTSCGCVYSSQVIPKLICDHSATTSETIDPTCESEGYDKVTCTVCNKVFEENRVPALGHDTGDGEITKEATCTEAGTRTYQCSRCDYQYTEPIAIKSHNYEIKVIKEATCTEDGTMNYKCTRCDYEENASIPTISHDYTRTITKEATCKEVGELTYTCSFCNYSYTTEISKTRHDSGSLEVEVLPTCTSYGKVVIKCTICKEVINSSSIPKVGHKAEWVVIKEATTTTEGLKELTCKDCGTVFEQQSIPKKCSHYKTCIEIDGEGNGWSVCSDCGVLLELVFEKPKPCTHDGYGKKRVLIQPIGENQDGIWNYICKNCGEVLSTTTYPGYQTYIIDTGDGTTEEVYGYYLTDMSQEIWDMTNTYRSENGVKTLNYASWLQNECDIRARECAVKFDHVRPNGKLWDTLNSRYMQAENIAVGYDTASSVMTAWKNSEGHNANLLWPRHNSLAVSTFVKYYLLDDETQFPGRGYFSVQTFSYYPSYYPQGSGRDNGESYSVYESSDEFENDDCFETDIIEKYPDSEEEIEIENGDIPHRESGCDLVVFIDDDTDY